MYNSIEARRKHQHPARSSASLSIVHNRSIVKSGVRGLRRRVEFGLRLYYASPWVNSAFRSEAMPIVVGGCDRSGTTLLRATLDCHPAVAAGPESWVFVYKIKPRWLAAEYGFDASFVETLRAESRGLAEFVDRFMDEFRRRENKAIWCEKSPRNVLRFDYILRHFPKARLIHIIRDGRDVACSLRNHPKRIRVGNTYVPNTVSRPIGSCINHWVRYVSAGLRHRGDERYMEVRYEDLVRDYEGTTKAICRHCGLDWSPQLLEREKIQGGRADTEIVNTEVRDPLYQSAVGRWREDLNGEEQRLVSAKAGRLLHLLGYACDADARVGLLPAKA